MGKILLDIFSGIVYDVDNDNYYCFERRIPLCRNIFVNHVAIYMIQKKAIRMAASRLEQHSRISRKTGYALSAVSAKTHL